MTTLKTGVRRFVASRQFVGRASSIGMPVAAIALSFLIGALVIAWSGKDPFQAYYYLLRGAFGGRREIATTLVKSIPLMLTGLSITIAFRCGIWNVGAEGQLHLGAISAAWAGSALRLPAAIHIPLSLLISGLGGLLWALIPALLKVKRGFNEIITTILFSYIGISFTSYLIGGPLHGPGWARQTETVSETARLPILVRGTNLNAGLLLAIVIAIAMQFLFERTTFGYELRAVGLNRKAARAAGIRVGWVILSVFLISGALSGLAGAAELLGYQHRLVEGFSPGYGWDGMAVSLLGAMNPIGTLAAAIFFGGLRAGANSMQVGSGLTLSVIQLIQGLAIVFTLAGTVVRLYSPRSELATSEANAN